MQIQTFDPTTVTVNPAMRTRRGAPDPEKVARFTENFIARMTAGQVHQIQPGVVRILDNGVTELIVGEHRLEGCLEVNKKISSGDPLLAGVEPIAFYAIPIPEGDEQALWDAIDENLFRVATNVFDRAEAVGKLMDPPFSKTQADIAKRWGLSPATISRTVNVGKLPKKVQAQLRSIEADDEAAMLVAETVKEKRDDVITFLAAQYEERVRLANAVQGGASAKDVGKAAAEVEEAPGVEEEGKENGKGKTGKSGTTAKKNATRTTAKDVRQAKAAVGAGTENKSRKDFLTFLEAMFGEKEMSDGKPVPEPVAFLAQRLQQWFDGKIKADKTLKEAFLRSCRDKF